MVVGLGIDIVDLDEFRSGPVAERPDGFFLPGELEYARTQARSWESLAARLAAKGAVLRALGVGPAAAVDSGGRGHPSGDSGDRDDPRSGPAWHEVEVLRRQSGEVEARLTGGALAAARSMGVSACRLSISHTRRTALAVAILEDGAS